MGTHDIPAQAGSNCREGLEYRERGTIGRYEMILKHLPASTREIPAKSKVAIIRSGKRYRFGKPYTEP
jgi:hypothetical protein